MPRDRSSSPGAGDALDVVEVVDLADDDLPHPRTSDDLDDHTDDDERARPVRPRWLRSRWTVPVVVVVLGLLVEVSLGRQFRASAADDLAQAVQVSAVQLGGASVVSAFTGDPASYDARGRLLTEVQVQVLNSGAQGVRLTVRGTSEPLLELVGAQQTTPVGPDGSNTLVVRAAVDCSRAPRVLPSYSSTEGAAAARAFSLDLDVAPGSLDGADRSGAAGGEVQRHRYLVADSGFGWGDVGQQLAYACDPTANGALGVSLEPRDDGAMVMTVRNDTTAPVAVAMESTPWLRATSDPSAPVTVPAEADLPVVVRLRPDCSAARAPSEGGLDLRVDLVPVTTGAAGSSSLSYDSARTTAWAARQVALACG